MTGTQAGGRDRADRHGDLPEDAHRGFVAPAPTDAAEAAADRAMADAERAVVLGTATDRQRTRVAALADLRSQEDRRARWMAAELPTAAAPGSTAD